MSETFMYTNSRGVDYYLNCKEVTLRGGHQRVIYYFTKDVRDTACAMPEDYKVVENPRNGFCALKKVVEE